MANENIIPDGNTDFSAGQNASRAADKIAADGYYAGINVTTEEGALGPRWGYEELELKFPKGGIRGRSWETIFKTGRFQAVIPCEYSSGDYVAILINGIIFLVNLDSYEVRVPPLEGQQIAENHIRVNWSFADEHNVIFDYPNYPVIFDSVKSRRADPAKQEIPVSRMGALNSSRLFVVNGQNEFTGGDPVGSQATPDAPLTFVEVLTSGSDYYGDVYRIPTNYQNQEVTAMSFLQVADTSTGIGPLLVSTRKMMASYPVSSARENWKKNQFGSVLLYNTGVAGQRAQVNVNSDLYFLSADGQLRTLAMSRDQQGKMARVPISREVKNWLKYNDKNLAEFSSIAYFENKILVTANPFLVPAYTNSGERTFDVAFGGMVVLESDNITEFGASGKPAWAGLWTGIRPMDFAQVREQLYAVSKDRQNINKLYRIRNDRNYDVVEGRIRQIKSRVYTREYIFQDKNIRKELNSIELDLDDVSGDFEIDIKYKAAHSKSYNDWKVFKHKTAWKYGDEDSIRFNGYETQSFKDLSFGAPTPKYDSVSKESTNNFKRLGLKIDITGISWKLSCVKINAKIDPPVTNNNTLEIKKVTNEEIKCNNDWNLEDLAYGKTK